MPSKKRTRVSDSMQLNTSKPSRTFQKAKKGRKGTVSIALPASIIANAQGQELKARLAGQIARIVTIFCLDEVIVFDDGSKPSEKSAIDPMSHLTLLLSYLECPPNLRKRLFQLSPSLASVGVLPSLDAAHHLKVYEWCQYREGVAVGPISVSQKRVDHQTLVDAGFPVAVPGNIPAGSRVTIKFTQQPDPPNDFPWSDKSIPIDLHTKPVINAEVQDPCLPREEGGYHWGYTVRNASSLSAVFTESPFDEGYDFSIGTSERGESIYDIMYPAFASSTGRASQNQLPDTASHVLIIFGGLAGLERAAEADADLKSRGLGGNTVDELFDLYVDVCPGQGSRTIRTEEAITITLSQFRPWIMRAVL